MSIAKSSLKHITSISLEFAPLSASQASRSMRLLLATWPTKAPQGVDLPTILTKTVPIDTAQKVSVTYKNKDSLTLDFKAASTSLPELLKKIEGPARALRMKEEGL
ncbi:hypothetical protein BCV70DRAFT_104212 [Testicularia cyperi]|uniref:Uncharacterized protein n=1 Tax=Testicularia cyperi TaxID=1882483 RepID=A0A317XQF6_9BASI|nr:hypothetical protein BCV70DRAFT_104212 [Testicularia cyperi]